MVLKQKQKHRPMEQDKILEINLPMGTLSLTKQARIYSGEKTASSVSCAGKTG